MKPWVKGVVIAAVQVGLVASLGAKLLYDRATRPRVWALTAPYDPSLPIRGRYVRLQLVVEPRGFQDTSSERTWQAYPAALRVVDNRLVAEAASREGGNDPSNLRVRFIERAGAKLAVLDTPVAFFISEHIPDPSRRGPNEALWVEVTLPKKGPPRPIRLGVKTGDGPPEPLALQ